MTADAITIERPADNTDGRWVALQSQARLMITGHMPWCEEHHDAGDSNGGYCTNTARFFAGEACLNNGGTGGAIAIALHLEDHLNLDEMSVAQAEGLVSMLQDTTRLARLWAAGSNQTADAASAR
jgi:hypothetical protein